MTESIQLLVSDIERSLISSFQHISPNPNHIYPPHDQENDLFAYFPSLRRQHGNGNYEADRKQEEKSESCRKESWGHPTLSPGIFTLYCQHGVCYGLTLMHSHESPRHPFEVFKTRFKKAPNIIIYDNACTRGYQKVLSLTWKEPEIWIYSALFFNVVPFQLHTLVPSSFPVINTRSVEVNILVP